MEATIMNMLSTPAVGAWMKQEADAGNYRPTTLLDAVQAATDKQMQDEIMKSSNFDSSPAVSPDQIQAMVQQYQQDAEISGMQQVLSGFAQGQMASPYAGNRVMGASIAGALGAKQQDVQQKLSIQQQVINYAKELVDLKRQKVMDAMNRVQFGIGMYNAETERYKAETMRSDKEAGNIISSMKLENQRNNDQYTNALKEAQAEVARKSAEEKDYIMKLLEARAQLTKTESDLKALQTYQTELMIEPNIAIAKAKVHLMNSQAKAAETTAGAAVIRANNSGKEQAVKLNPYAAGELRPGGAVLSRLKPKPKN